MGFHQQYSSSTTDEYLLKKRRLSNKDFEILTNCWHFKAKGQSSWIGQQKSGRMLMELHLQGYILFEYEM